MEEWRAYEEIEPFTRRRADIQAAMVVQAIVNQWVEDKEDAVELQDVLPRFGESTYEREARAEEQAQQTVEKVRRTLGNL